MRELYWCDRCYKDYVNDEEEVERMYFSCTSNQPWARHLKTTKHINNCKNVEESDECIECKYCNKKFTKDGWTCHEERNKKLWKYKNTGGFKDLKCNNFKTKSRRFVSFDEYLVETSSSKPIKRRTVVGKVSQATGEVRGYNSNKTTITHSNMKNKTIDCDGTYQTCNKCKGAFNDTNYIDKEFIKVFNTNLCTCPIEPLPTAEEMKKKMTKEFVEFSDKPSQGWSKSIKVIKNNDYDKNLGNCYRLGDGTNLSDEALSYTEKPQLEVCSICTLPIAYEGDYPKEIINLWFKALCQCGEDTDDE